jgi:hypothetical protein
VRTKKNSLKQLRARHPRHNFRRPRCYLAGFPDRGLDKSTSTSTQMKVVGPISTMLMARGMYRALSVDSIQLSNWRKLRVDLLMVLGTVHKPQSHHNDTCRIRGSGFRHCSRGCETSATQPQEEL